MTQAGDHAERPRVVAVVPAYQPGPNLLSLVTSLLGQSMRVVVVDDGSPTASDLLDVAAEAGAQVLQHEANLGIAAALNIGIRAALTEGDPVAVLTVDQDSDVPERYVVTLLNTWAKAERSGVRVA